jgi:NADH-quinone oxidoreductase subunit M
VVAAAGVILAALYLLWAYQRVFHGEPDENNRTFPELRLKEAAILLPFIGIIVFTGVYPKPMLDRIEPSVNRVINRIEVEVNTFREPVTQGGSQLGPIEGPLENHSSGSSTGDHALVGLGVIR